MTDGTYTDVHRRMLLLVSGTGDQHFRTEIAAAHMNLSIEGGRAVARDLLEIGFIARETSRHQRQFSFGGCVPREVRVEGPDDNGRFEYVEETGFYNLTKEGREEVDRLQRKADGPMTVPDLHKEVRRLRSESHRLRDEVRVLTRIIQPPYRATGPRVI